MSLSKIAPSAGSAGSAAAPAKPKAWTICVIGPGETIPARNPKRFAIYVALFGVMCPAPGDKARIDWRMTLCEAIERLLAGANLEFDIIILDPRAKERHQPGNYPGLQLKWEADALAVADITVFWFAGAGGEMSLVELTKAATKGKGPLFVGVADSADEEAYLRPDAVASATGAWPAESRHALTFVKTFAHLIDEVSKYLKSPEAVQLMNETLSTDSPAPPPYESAAGVTAAATTPQKQDSKVDTKTPSSSMQPKAVAVKPVTYVWCLPKNNPREWKDALVPFECGFCKTKAKGLSEVTDTLRWCNACADHATHCPKCKEKTYWTDSDSKTEVVLAAGSRPRYGDWQNYTGVYYAVHGCITCKFVKRQVPCITCDVPQLNGQLKDGVIDECDDCEYARQRKKTK